MDTKSFNSLHLEIQRIEAESLLTFEDSIKRIHPPSGPHYYSFQYAPQSEELMYLADAKVESIELSYNLDSLVDFIEIRLDTTTVTDNTRNKILDMLNFNEGYDKCRLSIVGLPLMEEGIGTPFYAPSSERPTEIDINFNGIPKEGRKCGSEVIIRIGY